MASITPHRGGRGDGAAATSKKLHLTNKLAESRSPYVRGHMNNPVAWQMWGDEAISLAKKHNRLIFLSIGYAACHWCHVMERESFNDASIASLLNNHFIPIKVDREERPDVDRIYMNYVQATTGTGGWPLNVFVTPDLEPVFGGTYWPGPNSNMPHTLVGAVGEQVGFLDVLKKIRDVWIEQEGRCRQSAKEILDQLRSFAEEGTLGGADRWDGNGNGHSGEEVLELDLLEEAYQHFSTRFDSEHGGFSLAPKFPTPPNLSFLLRLSAFPAAAHDIVGPTEVANALAMATHTLRAMARGGIHDHIGGGFHRYSVTADWALPHFEKMLVDNAQLLGCYLDAFLLGGDPEMLGAVYSTASYLLTSRLHSPEGAFYSSEDADSLPTPTDDLKREGAFYVLTYKTLSTILSSAPPPPPNSPPPAIPLSSSSALEVVSTFYNISPNGNIPSEHDPHDDLLSQNVLHIVRTPSHLAKDLGIDEKDIVATLRAARHAIRDWRARNRPLPGLDDKVVAAWNGLAIASLARAGGALKGVDEDKSRAWIKAAKGAARFLKTEMWSPDRKILYRVWQGGKLGETEGFLDDYAAVVHGCIELYHATAEAEWLRWAGELMDLQNNYFLAPSSQPLTGGAPSSPFIDPFHPTSPLPSHPAPSSGGYYSTSPHLQTHTPQLLSLLRLKPGMDTTEPSPNALSVLNLFRLSNLLGHSSASPSSTSSKSSNNEAIHTNTGTAAQAPPAATYTTLALSTLAAFEVEIAQHPGLFPGCMEGIVVSSMSAPTLSPSSKIAGYAYLARGRDPLVVDWIARWRAGVRVGETLVWISSRAAEASSEASSEAPSASKQTEQDEDAQWLSQLHPQGGKEKGIWLCEPRGVCRKLDLVAEERLRLEKLREALPRVEEREVGVLVPR